EVAEVDGRVVARIMLGKTMSAYDILTLQMARQRMMESLRKSLDGAFVLCPTVAHVAPEIAPLDADPVEFGRVNLKTLRNTMMGNFLNWPGVALPAASPSALPVSLLVSAMGGEDERLLGAAWAMESLVRDG
ncbi:MAG: amidase, partial [Pseudomonadota bacterium]